MRTFAIQTLGCRVNHYEAQQLAALLRARGLAEVPAPQADLRVIHTCSVTVQAASKSRQSVRRMTRLRVLSTPDTPAEQQPPNITPPSLVQSRDTEQGDAPLEGPPRRRRVVVTGCWAASNPAEARSMAGVDAVLGHDHDVARELSRLLDEWMNDTDTRGDSPNYGSQTHPPVPLAEPEGSALHNNCTIIDQPATSNAVKSKSPSGPTIKGKLEEDEKKRTGFQVQRSGRHSGPMHSATGTTSLPLLGERQTGYQRAFLKVQDGCDAHCTYCIIPRLRPRLWSKPVADAVEEASRLVAAGHVELVLTGIFLGAYGHATALRRRQNTENGAEVGGGDDPGSIKLPTEEGTAERSHAGPATMEQPSVSRLNPARSPIASLVEALCTRVPGLRRVRLSSLEPGDLTDELLDVLAGCEQVVPHFHVPLQSGSERLLRRMNRQYGRDNYRRMLERLRRRFDRPALTTDIIVGFPGETEEEFERTLEVMREARFIHVHAFPFSPRPGTAAARWTRDGVHGPAIHERIEKLVAMACDFSMGFRQQFLGQTVEILVERNSAEEQGLHPLAGYQHGRCERYFPVHFESTGNPETTTVPPGTPLRVRIDRVTATHTFGTPLEVTV